MTRASPIVLFFGCWNTSGHYLHAPGGRVMPERNVEILLPPELQLRHLDGRLQPNDAGQVEQRFRVHHLADWTVLAFWDRTVDHRRNSCAAFLVQGSLAPEAALQEAWRAFPELQPRFPLLRAAGRWVTA